MSKHTRSATKGLNAVLAYHPRTDPDPTVDETEISDLITDLCHLALSLDFDVDDVLRRAAMNYEAEIPGQEDDLALDDDWHTDPKEG